MACFLVTRAMPDAEETANAIRTAGHQAILAPLRRVEAVHSPVPLQPDALMATSANALRYGAPIPDDWRDLPVYCVGERTAEAARALGFSHVEAAQADVERLIAQCRAQMSLHKRILYLAGEPRRPDLEQEAAKAGVPLALWLRYRMVDEAEFPAEAKTALTAKTCNAVLHFSAESVATLARLAEIAGVLSALALPMHICLSQAIAERVTAEIGAARLIIAKTKDASGVLEAVKSAFPGSGKTQND